VSISEAERLSVDRFLEALRRIVPARPALPIEKPLDVVLRQIEKAPAFTQSRLLTRVLVALTSRQGEFRRAEVSAFDSKTLALVIALMDAHAAGTTTREEWTCAVELANAAQLAAGG
jgi:hypothetical protein